MLKVRTLNEKNPKIWFKSHYFIKKIREEEGGVWYVVGADDDVWPIYYNHKTGNEKEAETIDFDGGPMLSVGCLFPKVGKKILKICMNNTIKLEL